MLLHKPKSKEARRRRRRFGVVCHRRSRRNGGADLARPPRVVSKHRRTPRLRADRGRPHDRAR